MIQGVLSCCFRRLFNPLYRGDREPERTLRLLRRFQTTRHLPGSPHPFLVFDLEEELIKEERVMAYNDILDISKDMERNMMEYVVFDSNAMNTNIIRPEINVAHFEFKQ